MSIFDKLATKATDFAVRAGLFCVETVLEKTGAFKEEEKPVQKQLQLPYTGLSSPSPADSRETGKTEMAMNTPPTGDSTTTRWRPNRRTNRYISGKTTASATTTTTVTYPKRDHRVVRHYLGSAAYPQRVIEELLTESEAREHCLSTEACSMTCTSKAGKRRTRRLGHWFDTFEQYR